MKKKPLPPDFLHRFDAFIEQALRDRNSHCMAALCAHFGVCGRTINKWMNGLTGMNVQQYILRLRYRIAAERMRSGEYETVMEVCRSVGLKDCHKFCQRFEDFYYMKPADYMRISREGLKAGYVMSGGELLKLCRECGSFHVLRGGRWRPYFWDIKNQNYGKQHRNRTRH